MIDLVFYLVVFLAVGTFFLFIHLLMGKFIRPNRPDPEKMTIYECGEPTVGSAWIQFDLRYYVVALLFVVFDVEVAFFFPWAVVFGKANDLARSDNVEHRAALTKELAPAELNLAYLEVDRPKSVVMPKGGSDAEPNKGAPKSGKGGTPGPAKGKPPTAGGGKKGGAPPGLDPAGGPPSMQPPGAEKKKPPDVKTIDQQTARTWAWIAFGDIFVFFSVLMVGFAYLWKRGDIDWVRSTISEK